MELIGSRIAYPVGDNLYQLGIRTGPKTLWLDSGKSVTADDSNTVEVANPDNTPRPIEASHLQRVDWLGMLHSQRKCPTFGTSLLYAIWGTVRSLAPFNVHAPRIVITDDLPVHNLGLFILERGTPTIKVARNRFYTYAGLASIIAHEYVHQVQRTVFKTTEQSHGATFLKLAHEIADKTGIKIHTSTDMVNDAKFQVSDQQVKSKWPIYYLIVPGPQPRVTYSDSQSEINEIALSLDPDMTLYVYKSFDSAPVEWLTPATELKNFTRVRNEVVKTIITNGKRIYP